MFLVIEDRLSDSPYVERIWRSHSERAGTLLSVAASHCELVVTRHRNRMRLTLRGPETKASPIDCPADAEWIGIRLAVGAFMPHHPAATLRDRQDVDLPSATDRSFWMEGSAWAYPSFENAEALVSRLARAGLLARDPAVAAVLAGDWGALSRRSAQRHFLLSTGMTHRTYRQIQRARFAAQLLHSGATISDAVHQAGYFDQPHLTRSLKRLIGTSPARIRQQEQQLSLLYKTARPG